MKRKAIAADTLKIMEHGTYFNENGEEISISQQLEQCVNNTKLYRPQELTPILATILSTPRPFETTFMVANETTLQGAQRLTEIYPDATIGVLNFASAKNPGGGFLGGAQAQEESLARSSGLYNSLLEGREYYRFHRSQKSCLYSNHMIYSPGCPVFKDDQGNKLATPHCVDFLTSPAPNAGVVKRQERGKSKQIEPTLYERGEYLLALFLHHKVEHLVLGAWGCGVFQNDPAMVAEMFAHHLKPGGSFYGYFQSVRFSIYSRGKKDQSITRFQHYFEDVADIAAGGIV